MISWSIDVDKFVHGKNRLTKIGQRQMEHIGFGFARISRRALPHLGLNKLHASFQVTGRGFPRDELADALAHAPAGLFDLRSWHYWHRVLGQPVPPRPTRQIPGEPNGAASSKLDFHVQKM